MKNVLFASTALVAFAGAASAQSITLSGFAEMGIFNAESFAGGVVVDGETQFHTDIDVTFTMAGETDGGLTFGAQVNLEEAAGGIATTAEDDFSVFLSGAFGTLTAGDTDGALDWALAEVNFAGGSITDDETDHAGYNGLAGLDGLFDGQIVRYDNTFGAFGVALSAELDDTDGAGNDDVLGLGFRYTANFGGTDIALGLGYQTASLGNVDVDTLGVSANASFGAGFTAGFNYVTYENHIPSINQFTTGRVITAGQDTDYVGVGVGYTTGAISANLNYGQYDSDRGDEAQGVGLSVGYDLGGGASVQFGYGTSSADNAAGVDLGDVDTVSLGVRMNF